uniref:DNA-directed RNA polymerase RpoA/D/Rpb3-type domain-containing protein n=1 Tax=Nelumbo nucifera TaxID=4432 RepID=A0A822ZLA9_NELNU|nr:TPA_asm: hypothetical protein HUJ06_002561 [Nelumbo nucifera]
MTNSLCHIMLAEILTIAIDFIEIEVNSFVLNDEFITHHLGLILDGQCEYCFVKFHLKVRYHSDHTLDVISCDLKISNPSVVLTNAAQYAESGGYNAFEQRAESEMRVIVGKGITKDHAKWSLAPNVTSVYEPNMYINWIESIPTRLLTLIPILIRFTMGKAGLVEIYATEDSFIFIVESIGAIKALQMVINAIEVLKQKLDAIKLLEETEDTNDQLVNWVHTCLEDDWFDHLRKH